MASVYVSSGCAFRNPIARRAGCCAPARSGHAAAPRDELVPFHAQQHEDFPGGRYHSWPPATLTGPQVLGPDQTIPHRGAVGDCCDAEF
jgi:hypothetical protein